MIQTVILAGGNSSTTKDAIKKAEQEISARIGEVVSVSEWHTTEPWGFKCDNAFTNRAYVVNTELSATEVLETLLEIEVQTGRNRRAEYKEKVLRGENYASRVIDLDILLYGDTITVTPHLQIPHPKLLERDFALVPMCEALGLEISEARDYVRKIIEQ